MEPEVRRQLLLYAVGFGCFFQQSVLFPVLPQFAGEFGISLAAIGIVLGVRFLVPSLLAALLGELASRLGLRRSLVLAGIGMVGAAALYGVATSVHLLVLAQIANGVLYLLAWISAQTYATRMANRNVVVGVFATCTALGMAIAPVLGGIALDLGGYGAAFMLYAVGAAALALAAWGLGDAAIGRPMRSASLPLDPSRSRRAATLLARPGVLAAFLFSFLCLFAISVRGNLVPLYLEPTYSASAIGLVLGTGSLGQAAVRPFTHLLLSRFSLSATMTVAILLGALGMALMPLAEGILLLSVLAFVHGGGAGLHQSLGLVLLADDTTEEERGYAIGLRATSNHVAVAGAPIIGGGIAHVTGAGPSIVGIGLAIALAAGWLHRILRTIERRPDPEAARTGTPRSPRTRAGR